MKEENKQTWDYIVTAVYLTNFINNFSYDDMVWYSRVNKMENIPLEMLFNFTVELHPDKPIIKSKISSVKMHFVHLT